MFIDDLNDSGMDIPDIERAIGFLDEYVVLRVQTTPAQTGFVSCCKQDFFLCHSMWFLSVCVSLRAMATPGGIGEIAVFPAV